MILHEFSFNINFYETSLGNVIKGAFCERNNIPKTIFIELYTCMQNVRFSVSHDIEVCMDIGLVCFPPVFYLMQSMLMYIIKYLPPTFKYI